MRNKNYVIGALAVLAIIIITMVFVIVFWDDDSSTSKDDKDTNPFGNTSGNRPAASSTVIDPFGNASGDWLTGGPGAKGPDAMALRAITNQPSMSPIIVTETSGSSSIEYVRYIDRVSGNAFETPLATILAPKTISFTTILRVGEAEWAPDGETALLRYLGGSGLEITSYLATLSSSTNAVEATDFVGRYLPKNIITSSFSPDNRSVFYIIPTDSGSAGYIESIVSGARTEVWLSPLRSITAVWKSANTILVYSNPSITATGFLWKIQPSSGTVDTVIGERYALAALPDPAGERILYSMHENVKGLQTLRVLQISTGEITHMPTPTIVEKCVWGPLGSDHIYCAIPSNMTEKNYLENWYQGVLASNDTLWRYNVVTGTSELLVNPLEKTKTSFDIIELSVGTDEDYAVFRTKGNDWIWAVDLPNEPEAIATSTEEVVEDTEVE